MYELFCLFACFIVPVALLIAGVVWYARRPRAATRPPDLLSAMRQRLEAWISEGRLSAEEAAPVMRILAEELRGAVVAPGIARAARPVVAPAPVQAPPTEAPVVPVPVAEPSITPRVTAPPQPARPPQPSAMERVWAGVLALRTRQMLLFLGAFLLVVSSLVLVVFNWERVPAVFQCGLLVAVCGALWGAGELLERRWKMESAGAGLRAVAGVLVPIVGGAITRLLQIEPHPAWLVVSLACLPLYIVAARRTGQLLFSVAASLAGASVVLAATGFVSWQALPAVLCLALVGYLPIARRLLTGSPNLSKGPQWTAHVLVPAALTIAGALTQAGLIDAVALAAALAAGMLFYATAALIDRWAIWSWAASTLGPCAVFVLATDLQPGRPAVWVLALITGMALYLAGARLLRLRGLQVLAIAPYVVAHAIVPVALLGVELWTFGSAEGSLVLWAGFIFYALALIFEPVGRWSIVTAFIVPVALISTCFANGLTAPTTIEGALLILAAGFIVLSRFVRGGKHRNLAIGPLASAHSIVPLAVANILLNPASGWANPLLLWGTASFYLLALALDRWPLWLWPALTITPVALLVTAYNADWGFVPTWALLSLLVPGYAALGIVADHRSRWYALPGYVLGALLGLLVGAGAALSGVEAVRWSLPALAVACVLLIAASHRKRLEWLGAYGVEWVSSVVLGVGVLVLAAWLWSAFDLFIAEIGWRAVALLPLAGLVFAGARFWPGRLRGGYAWALQIAATALAFTFAPMSLEHADAGVVGFALLTFIWTLQLFFRRSTLWATLALGTAVCAAAVGLQRFGASEIDAMLAALGFACMYTLGAARARKTAWRCLTIPATAIGAVAGLLPFVVALDAGLGSNQLQPIHVGAVLALAALAAGHSAIWRRWWLGYIAGPLLAIGLVLAASRGFFVAARPQVEDYAYVLCGLTITLLALGEVLRQRFPRYAAPYEQLGFVLLVGALPLAGFEPQHAALVWLCAALVSGYMTFRHRIAWAILTALLAGDVALLFGTAWLAPGGALSGAGLLLVGAAWAQAALGLGSRRFWPALRGFVYAATAVSGGAGLAFAASGVVLGGAVYVPTMQAAFGLAALLGLLASAEQREQVAWGALGSLALGLACWHAQLGAPQAWIAAYGVAEALMLCLVGWVVDQAASRSGRLGNALLVWRRVLGEGVLVAGTVLATLAALLGIRDGLVQPLIFALVMLALLLATVAVRRRRIELGYAAGGALVAAALAQLFEVGVREPQGYALPSGLYLLALADGLRRFQGRRHVARLLECAAIGLTLGTAATQAVQTDGARGFMLTLALCAMSFALLAYGVVRRLQVPFVGGAAGFVFGVLWLTVDPLQATNSWVILGLLGLGLVGLYVLLERRQEQLVRAGRVLIEHFSGWG